MSEQMPVDLILMNLLLNDPVDGITTSDKILKKRDIPIIYLSEYTEEELKGRIKGVAPYGYLRKPIDKRELISTIQMALSRHDRDRVIRKKDAQYWVFIHDNLLPAVTDDQLIREDLLSDSWMNEPGEWMAS